ncbi:MAG: hypothetical protein FWF54_00045, partial [Candidatus Azobacteroides sp.]|nr:hypothetical protein [Candidatus Azobacteroides sp.]
MPTTNITTLKSWFEKYKKPLQVQFADWIDSYWHKNEQIPLSSIDRLTEILEAKTDKEVTEYYKSLKRIVTAVHTYQELQVYPVQELTIGDGIIVERDETFDGKTSLYVFQSDKTWKFHISWVGEDSLKGVDGELVPLTEDQLEVRYGDKGVGFELWCDKAWIKYTKFSEYQDETDGRVSLWHQFNYKSPGDVNVQPQPEESNVVVTDSGIGGRYLTTGGDKLYVSGTLLYSFDGNTWTDVCVVNYPTAIDYFDGAVYFADNEKLRKYENGVISDVWFIVQATGQPAGGQDWWSICKNDTDLFVG